MLDQWNADYDWAIQQSWSQEAAEQFADMEAAVRSEVDNGQHF